MPLKLQRNCHGQGSNGKTAVSCLNSGTDVFCIRIMVHGIK